MCNAEETYSRNIDAHDVPLDGPTRVTVGRPVCETESEINVLVPRVEAMSAPLYGAPDWVFVLIDYPDLALRAELP